eukprot:scaffold108678_cov27-Phaeocystis_antarctica.AAC.1
MRLLAPSVCMRVPYCLTATCAPAAPGPSANEIVARTITQVENLLDKTLVPLAERLSSIEATQREGGGGGGSGSAEALAASG